MSTDAAIWVEKKSEDNKIYYKGVTVLFDGYFNGVGRDLFDNFNTLEDVINLTSHGDIRRIDENKVDYIGSARVAYKMKVDTIQEILDGPVLTSYIYLFKDNTWFGTSSENVKFQKLEELIK